MMTPERSLAQRRAALERANEVRTARKVLKAELKAGTRSIDSLLLHPPAVLLTARATDFLLMVPRYGHTKVNKLLRVCGVAPSKTFGGLTDRQRMELVRTIREWDAAYYVMRERCLSEARYRGRVAA